MQGATKEWNEISLDTGCEYSPSCLTCPLPVCKHEAPLSTQLRIYRDAMIIKELEERDPAESRRDMAKRLGISFGVLAQARYIQSNEDPTLVESILSSEWIKRLVNGAG